MAFTKKMADLEGRIDEVMAEIVGLRIEIAEGKLEAHEGLTRIDELLGKLDKLKADKLRLSLQQRLPPGWN